MHINTLPATIVTLLGILTSTNVLGAAPLEEKYLEARDSYIQQYKKSAALVDDQPALAELEKIMRTILGPATFEGFPQQGKINLETLQNEMGFGRLDGLSFYSGRETLVVTTEYLLKRYLAERPKLPKDFRELSKNGTFYTEALFSGAAITYYAELPVTTAKGQSFARAFLGLSAQDIGPFIPKEIFVFATEGDRILLVRADAAMPITDIAQCRSEWDKYQKKRSKAFEAYRTSQLKDKKAFDSAVKYDEQGFEAYHNCFGMEARNQPFFSALRNQAQAVVNRLQKK